MNALSLELFYFRLDALRVKWNFSWYQVAERAFVSPTIIIRIAQGTEPDALNLEKLYRWLDAYGG